MSKTSSYWEGMAGPRFCQGRSAVGTNHTMGNDAMTEAAWIVLSSALAALSVSYVLL